jgi:hypothetical protein
MCVCVCVGECVFLSASLCANDPSVFDDTGMVAETDEKIEKVRAMTPL